MTQRSRAILLTALDAAALGGAWLAEPPVRQAALAAGIVLLFLAATGAGVAGGAADRLAELRDRPVDVRVWGSPLPAAPPEGFQLIELRAFGAGLHIRLRSRGGDGSSQTLKVAQPRDVSVDPRAGRGTIRQAKYVQWKRSQLPRGEPVSTVAVELLLRVVREGEEVSPAATGPGSEATPSDGGR